MRNIRTEEEVARSALQTSTSAPDADPQLLEQGAEFLRLQQELSQAMSRQLAPRLEADFGIDLRLYFLLRCIQRGAVHPGEISKIIRLPNSVVSRHLDQLVERGLVGRSLDSEDSRRIKLTLTRKGSQIAKGAYEAVSAVVGLRLAHLPPAKRKDFLAMFAQICNDGAL